MSVYTRPFRSVNAPKNKFSASEDSLLRSLVSKYGEHDWDLISQVVGTKNSRQCHDRWFYNLSPKLVKTPFTDEEDEKLLRLLDTLGPKWVQISKYFAGRTDTQIKNRFKVLKRRQEASSSANFSDFSAQEESHTTKTPAVSIDNQTLSSSAIEIISPSNNNNNNNFIPNNTSNSHPTPTSSTNSSSFDQIFSALDHFFEVNSNLSLFEDPVSAFP